LECMSEEMPKRVRDWSMNK